ncbi:MAG: DedA family protein [Pirellulales bacterium]
MPIPSHWETLLIAAGAAFAHVDLGTIASGVAAARGDWRWWSALAGCLVGSYAADLLWYGSGRLGGRWALERAPLKWVLKPAHLARAESWFAKRGLWTIVLCRFVPGASTPLQFAIGAINTPWPVALRYLALAVCVHVPVLFGLAYFVGELALRYLPNYRRWGLLAAAVLVALVWLVLRAAERWLTARKLAASE